MNRAAREVRECDQETRTSTGARIALRLQCEPRTCGVKVEARAALLRQVWRLTGKHERQASEQARGAADQASRLLCSIEYSSVQEVKRKFL